MKFPLYFFAKYTFIFLKNRSLVCLQIELLLQHFFIIFALFGRKKQIVQYKYCTKAPFTKNTSTQQHHFENAMAICSIKKSFKKKLLAFGR